MIPPQVTLTTSCYNLKRFHSGCRSLHDNIESFDILLKLNCYLVIYGDSTTIPILRERRGSFGFDQITVYVQREYEELEIAKWVPKVRENRNHYWPTRDARTCVESHLMCCSKILFLQETLQSNPFNHDRFGWIDGNLCIGHYLNMKICEEYTPGKLLQAIEYTKPDKFHIQILNVLDKEYKAPHKKREMYEQYRWVVCGCFFTFGQSVGQRVLERLREVFETTTEQGYGHGEEMFFLEILDEFYDDIERSYGDYGQIINNWKTPTHNIYYIYELILKNYYNRGYYREAADCAAALMRSFHTHSVALEYWMYMHILEIWYDSTVRHCPEKQAICSNRIREICKTDVLLQAEYKKRVEYFDAMFRISICEL